MTSSKPVLGPSVPGPGARRYYGDSAADRNAARAAQASEQGQQEASNSDADAPQAGAKTISDEG